MLCPHTPVWLGLVWKKNRHLFYNFKSVIHIFSAGHLCIRHFLKSRIFAQIPSSLMALEWRRSHSLAELWQHMEHVNGRRRSGLCCKKSLKAPAWIIYCFFPPRLCQGVTVGASVLKYRLQSLSHKKKGTFFSPSQWGGENQKPGGAM